MNIKVLVFAILFVGLIFGCKSSVTKSVITLDAENTSDAVNLKLSDLANSFKLIPLETTRESLLDNKSEFFANEDYILAFSENGVFKFSPAGKFEKKLIGSGRGPNEIVNFSGCIQVVDKNNDLLYISNRSNKDTYLRYDLRAEHFIEPVRRFNNSFGYFDFVNDSVIIASDLLSDSKYAFYFQNLKGEFLSGIINSKRLLSSQSIELPQMSFLLKDGQNQYGWFQYDDTLFQIADRKLVPFLALNFKTRRDDPPDETLKNGDRLILFQSATPGFLIINVGIVEDAKSFYSVPSGAKGYFILYNHDSHKAARINSYTDDFIGETRDVSELSKVDLLNPFFLDVSSDQKIIRAYYPHQIKKAIEKGLNYKTFGADINNQLLNIYKSLQETDNPVLMIGSKKDKK